MVSIKPLGSRLGITAQIDVENSSNENKFSGPGHFIMMLKLIRLAEVLLLMSVELSLILKLVSSLWVGQ